MCELGVRVRPRAGVLGARVTCMCTCVRVRFLGSDVATLHAACVDDEGCMTAEKFAKAAASAGLLSYKPQRNTSPGPHRKTSSVIQTLLMESAGNTGQRFGMLTEAWGQCKPALEGTIASAHKAGMCLSPVTSVHCYNLVPALVVVFC